MRDGGCDRHRRPTPRARTGSGAPRGRHGRGVGGRAPRPSDGAALGPGIASEGVTADALAFERAALGGCDGWQAGLEAAGLEAARRALRVVPADLEWEETADGGIVLRFALPSGAYATAIMRELARERLGA